MRLRMFNQRSRPGTPGNRGGGLISSIALVEDEDAVAEMYRLGLEARGIHVRTYADSESFFKSLEKSLPDLVVLDWVLDGTSGAEVLKGLRKQPRTRELRVIVLSNLSKRDFASVISAMGPVEWLEKLSTHPLALADKISNLFDR